MLFKAQQEHWACQNGFRANRPSKYKENVQRDKALAENVNNSPNQNLMKNSSGRFLWWNPFLFGVHQRSVSNLITLKNIENVSQKNLISEELQKRRKIKECLPGILIGNHPGHHLKWHPNHGNSRHGYFGEGEGGLGFLLCMILEMGTRLGHASIHLKLEISKSQFHSRSWLWITLENRINRYVNEHNVWGNS